MKLGSARVALDERPWPTCQGTSRGQGKEIQCFYGSDKVGLCLLSS